MDQFNVGSDVKIAVGLTDEDGQSLIPDIVPYWQITNKDGYDIDSAPFAEGVNGQYTDWWDTTDLSPDVYTISIEVHVNGKVFIKEILVELI